MFTYKEECLLQWMRMDRDKWSVPHLLLNRLPGLEARGQQALLLPQGQSRVQQRRAIMVHAHSQGVELPAAGLGA
jgi:hypothetical protein